MSDNHVDDNYLHDVMTSNLADGGAIYLNGSQNGVSGSSPVASTAEGNYIAQDSQGNGAIYLDNGATRWTVSSNVVAGFSTRWAYVQGAYSIPAEYNTVQANYTSNTVTNSGGVNDGVAGTPDSTNTISGNSIGLTSWPSGATATMAAAGPAYSYWGNGPSASRSDLAYGKTATASSQYSTDFAPGNATDGNPATDYASGATDTSAHWQVDLGAPDTIAEVQVLLRQFPGGSSQYDYDSERQNFEIVVSNSSSLTSGYTVACAQGSAVLPYASSFSCAIPSGPWRYVSVVKTDSAQIVLSEVRVFGSADTDVASGQYASASSTYSGSYLPAYAADGNLSTIFASSVSTSNQYWEVYLAQAAALSRIDVTFRQDGYDVPAERENLQVWVSNNADMSLGYTVACTLGSSPVPLGGTFDCTVPSGSWQYVAVYKTDLSELVMAEVSVYGH
jgi:hypothetical protein